MFEGVSGPPPSVPLTLYTDAFVIRGSLASRQRRITDMLNLADDRFLVLSDVSSDEFGTRGETIRAAFAQVNLRAVLFAVADEPVQAAPELRTPKIAEEALISVPPFKVIGRIHLLPERSLEHALSELTGHFLPVTDATFWSDVLGEPRTTASLVAVNHERAQILAPHQATDPWAGLERGAARPEPPPEPTGW
ncbi:MAG TPA: hypothetical protein VFI69_11990 [Candidatus Limnocylindrales bacterium]|jgi:hypothetical protein|nr:hypothetical protein [Candidatus Limnocylindrales bacterium]